MYNIIMFGGFAGIVHERLCVFFFYTLGLIDDAVVVHKKTTTMAQDGDGEAERKKSMLRCSVFFCAKHRRAGSRLMAN